MVTSKRHCLAPPHVFAHLGMRTAGVSGEVSAFPGPSRWPSYSNRQGHPGAMHHPLRLGPPNPTQDLRGLAVMLSVCAGGWALLGCVGTRD